MDSTKDPWSPKMLLKMVKILATGREILAIHMSNNSLVISIRNYQSETQKWARD